MEFSSQEHWSGLPFLPPGVLPNPGIELRSPTLQADSLAGFPGGSDGKKSACSVGEGNGHPLRYSYLEKSHGWRSRVGYSPWGHKESHMTERLHFQCGRPGFDHRVGNISGEGNGNPFQYSCLENSMGRAAWRAAVCGVTKSPARLSD